MSKEEGTPDGQIKAAPLTPCFSMVESLMMRDGLTRAEATQYAHPQIQEMIRANRIDIKIA